MNIYSSFPRILLGCLLTVIFYSPVSNLFADQFPENNDTLLCRFVRFSWPVVHGTTGYNLQVTKSEDFSSTDIDLITTPPGAIIRDGIEFGQRYYWRVRTINSENSPGEWFFNSAFNTIVIPDSLQNVFEVDTCNIEEIQPGYTLTSSYGSTYGFDVEGDLLWYIPCEEPGWFISNWNITQLPNGKFIANNKRGIRIFDINDNTIWHTLRYCRLNCHHDALVMPNGNMLSIDKRLGTHIEGEDTTYWYYDVIVELNDHAREVWSWSCWDHISQEDYDSTDFSIVQNNETFEWLHSNACPFNPKDNTILLSVRNLNRIIKIAYPSGEIIWSMGTPMPSGDVDFGENIDFHRQHAPEVQENGDILFYDNHWDEEMAYSRALIVSVDPGREVPAQIEWEFRHEFSRTQGDADRLPNGNILITTGDTGNFYEVTEEGEVVWKVDGDFRVGTYRCERIDDFYPQAFEIVGPPDSILAARWRDNVPLKIYNIGSSHQEYHISVSSEAGWFRYVGNEVSIQPGDSSVVFATGRIPDDENLTDVLVFTVYPEVDPTDIKQWTTVVSPDPRTDVSPKPECDDEQIQIEIIPDNTDGYNRVRIWIQNPAMAELRIVDITGRTVSDVNSSVLKTGENFLSIPVNNLPNGKYFVIVSLGSAIYTETFSVIR